MNGKLVGVDVKKTAVKVDNVKPIIENKAQNQFLVRMVTKIEQLIKRPKTKHLTEKILRNINQMMVPKIFFKEQIK